MIYEYFRATGSYYAVLGLSDWFALTSDGIILFSVSEMPSDMILEVFYRSKLENSVQLQTELALYDQERLETQGNPNYSQFKTVVACNILSAPRIASHSHDDFFHPFVSSLSRARKTANVSELDQALQQVGRPGTYSGGQTSGTPARRHRPCGAS